MTSPAKQNCAESEDPARAPSSAMVANYFLTIIVTILVIAALRYSYAVTMPLAAAAVIIASLWPVKQFLDRSLPSAVSYTGTLAILVFAFGSFMAAIYFSAAQIVRAFSNNQVKFENVLSALTDWLDAWGIDSLGGVEAYNRLIDFAQMTLSNVYTVLVYLGLIAILVVLGLPAVPVLRSNLDRALTVRERREVLDTLDQIAEKSRQYLGITALTSLITGLASTLWALTLGLELAIVWGVLNFLLNFIPVVGNIVGIVPPTIYAAVQFQSLTMTLIVFFGFSILQIVISNFLYPALQAHRLALPAVVVVLAIALWSWIWGIAGAILAVPLTATLLMAGEHFRATRQLLVLLTGSKSD